MLNTVFIYHCFSFAFASEVPMLINQQILIKQCRICVLKSKFIDHHFSFGFKLLEKNSKILINV